jgi:hypothetical protein
MDSLWPNPMAHILSRREKFISPFQVQIGMLACWHAPASLARNRWNGDAREPWFNLQSYYEEAKLSQIHRRISDKIKQLNLKKTIAITNQPKH